MLKPARMKRIEVLILERDVRAVTEGLGRLGVVHLAEARAAEGGELVNARRLEEQLGLVHSLLERVSALCDTLEVGEDHAAEEAPFEELGELDAALRPVEERLSALVERRKQLDADIEAEYQVLRDVEAYRPIEMVPDALRGLSFLHFALGTLPARAVGAVREAAGDKAVLLPFKSPDGGQHLVALSDRTGRFALDSILAQHGFVPERLPERHGGTPAEVTLKAEERLLALAKEQEALRGEAKALAAELGGRLAAWRQRLRTDEQLLRAQAFFGHTSATCLITGYVPSVKVDSLREKLLRLTEGRVIIEVADPREGDPDTPTLLENPRLLKPFEMLVAGYGHPCYREIEPTPLVAASFLLMFGIMFGDVGQGAALVAAGLLMARRARGERLRDFGTLLWLCGAAAMLSGWVYGSFFGVERAITPPWGGWFPLDVTNIESIKPLLLATVGLGVVMMTLGVVLNLANRLRSRDYFALVVDKFGLVGFIFYWGALGLGIRTLVWETGPPAAWEVLALVVLPLVVLFFREPLHYLLARGGHAGNPRVLEGLMEGAVDILETVSSYAANTVSFVRVGAFALAHAAVCVAVFAIERMVRTAPGGPLWSLLVVVLGNALVIGLEGLVVSIQAMRLEYYEFFSKFFSGHGRAYHPFRLE
ncbi:MAG: hypothetical protein FJ290_10510 [Planctomycetes bacterium]|nr:hypothetical protein [Planctomycetota bacterium]